MKARPPDTGQRYRFVTGVLTGQREFELGQPEFIAREVVVGSVVRITPQVTVVLHQDEGVVVQPVEE